MANPRQRRKARSSAHKPIRQSQRTKKLLRKQPPIQGPKVLQDAWDKKKTVRQNYLALGLVHSLNPHASGGVERQQQTEASEGCSSNKMIPEQREGIPKGFGRIVRDETGGVVRIELGEQAEEGENAAAEDLIEERIWSQPRQHVGSADELGASREGKTEVVRALEHMSHRSGRTARFTSRAERGYLVGLIGKHHGDVESMARDRRLNPEQKTAGELKRAIAKAGGLERLEARAARK